MTNPNEEMLAGVADYDEAREFNELAAAHCRHFDAMDAMREARENDGVPVKYSPFDDTPEYHESFA